MRVTAGIHLLKVGGTEVHDICSLHRMSFGNCTNWDMALGMCLMSPAYGIWTIMWPLCSRPTYDPNYFSNTY